MRLIFELLLIIILTITISLYLDCNSINDILYDQNLVHRKTEEQQKREIQKLNMTIMDFSPYVATTTEYITNYRYLAPDCPEQEECNDCSKEKTEMNYHMMRYDTLKVQWEDLYKKHEQLIIQCK